MFAATNLQSYTKCTLITGQTQNLCWIRMRFLNSRFFFTETRIRRKKFTLKCEKLLRFSVEYRQKIPNSLANRLSSSTVIHIHKIRSDWVLLNIKCKNWYKEMSSDYEIDSIVIKQLKLEKGKKTQNEVKTSKFGEGYELSVYCNCAVIFVFPTCMTIDWFWTSWIPLLLILFANARRNVSMLSLINNKLHQSKNYESKCRPKGNTKNIKF